MSGSGLEALTDVWEWSGGPHGCPRVVWSPFWMSGSGQKALPDVRQWSGDPPGCPEVVGGPYRYSGVVGRPSRKSLSGGNPFWMSGSCREAPESPGGSACCPGVFGDPPGCPGAPTGCPVAVD